MDSSSMIAVDIAIRVVAVVALALVVLQMRPTALRRWIAWGRVKREQRRRERDRRVMMKYQRIGNGARRRK